MHVPLSRELHDGLMEQSQRLGAPATTLARTAIEEFVGRAKRSQIDEELRRYVAAVAGSGSELDQGLEEAGLESWLQLEE